MKKVIVFSLGFVFTLFLGFSFFSYFSSPSKYDFNELSLSDIDLSEAEEIISGSLPYVVYEPLTIESVFNNKNDTKKNSDSVVIVSTGDVIPARVTNAKMQSKGVEYPFYKVESLLKDSDLTVVNLEAPIFKGCPVTFEGMIFCGPETFGNALKKYGVGLATLENNHIGNYGLKGIEDTKRALKEAGVEYARFNEPYIVSIKGQTFGFLPVNGVGPAIDRILLSEKISELRQNVDVVVVSVHWGKEYTYDPARALGIAPDDPQEIGHLMIDSGADVVLGNHPHWVQGIELYKEGFISYGSGNFIFDQEWSQETKEGVVGAYTFIKGKLVDVKYTPIVIEDYAQPRIATDIEGLKILDAMKMSSIRIRNR